MELSEPFGLSRKALKLGQGTRRTKDKIAATIWTAPPETVIHAVHAEVTFEGADASAWVTVRQIAITALAVRPESKWHRWNSSDVMVAVAHLVWRKVFSREPPGIAFPHGFEVIVGI